MENPQRVVLVLMETLTRKIFGELSKYLVAEHIYRNVKIRQLAKDSSVKLWDYLYETPTKTAQNSIRSPQVGKMNKKNSRANKVNWEDGKDKRVNWKESSLSFSFQVGLETHYYSPGWLNTTLSPPASASGVLELQS